MTIAKETKKGNANAVPAEVSVEDTAPVTIPTKARTQPHKLWLVVLVLIFSDVLLAFLLWGGAAYIVQDVADHGALSKIAVASIGPIVALWIAMRMFAGLYPGYGLAPAEELRRQTYSTLSVLAIAAILALGFHVGVFLSRPLIGLGFLGLFLLAPLVRYLAKRGLKAAGMWGTPVVILGAGETGRQLVKTLKEEWGLGYKPVGVFDFRLAPRGGVLEGVPYGGSVTDAIERARTQRIDTVIFAMPHVRRSYLAEFVDKASLYFPHVLITPNLSGVTNSSVLARDLAGTFGLEIKQSLLNPWARRAKRALDLIGSVVGGLLISPLLLTIAVLIKMSSPGPVLYKQIRLGAEGKHFYCWKFRTMYADAAQLLTELLQSDPELRAEWEENHKLRNDPRITTIGRFLRKTSLDELPQLWNVLRGQMSLTGPRPIVDSEISRYRGAYELYRRVRPGMSGLWQVSGRNGIDYRERVAIDVYYVRNWSVWLDLIILTRTIRAVILGHGAS